MCAGLQKNNLDPLLLDVATDDLFLDCLFATTMDAMTTDMGGLYGVQFPCNAPLKEKSATESQ